MKIAAVVVFGLVSFASIVFGADVPVDSGVGFLDAIMKYLNELSPAVVAGFLTVIEFVLRLVPTVNPASVLVPVKKVLDVVVFILGYVSELLAKLISVGQRLK